VSCCSECLQGHPPFRTIIFTFVLQLMQEDLKLSSYHYHLPEELIAQHPAAKRDNSRLMVVDTRNDSARHLHFHNVADLIAPQDMLVVNDTRVFPARLQGRKESGGKAEVFLLEFPAVVAKTAGRAIVTALIKASKRPRAGTEITINENLHCLVRAGLADGKAELQLEYNPEMDLADLLAQTGQVPLPPYITRTSGTTEEDRERYQTVYADRPGAVAAPTAGLHFTPELLAKLTGQGTQVGRITLHVGYGTFAPVRHDDITEHQIHHEYLEITEETVSRINEVKTAGGRIWAVGTTSVRALEFGARKTGKLEATNGWCDLYIYPGFTFRVVDNLITNFHLPDSSLMFLVSALCGRKRLLACYEEAVKESYRFFSYGDAMAIITK